MQNVKPREICRALDSEESKETGETEELKESEEAICQLSILPIYQQMPSTISGINRLPYPEKRTIYAGIIPPELLDAFNIPSSLQNAEGHDLLELNCPQDSADAEMALFPYKDAPDPIFYGHVSDTLNGQIHILLYGLNDPTVQRFNVDRLPDGTKTNFGTQHRNLEAEKAALKAGLAPGQIYRGPHLFTASMRQFERFIISLGHDIYFAEPLYYHVAVVFERHGFTYQSGRRLMQSIERGFSPGGDFLPLLDDSNPFRQPSAAHNIRLCSWAIHDGILGQPYTGVTMYKYIGKHAGISTTDKKW